MTVSYIDLAERRPKCAIPFAFRLRFDSIFVFDPWLTIAEDTQFPDLENRGRYSEVCREIQPDASGQGATVIRKNGGGMMW